MVRSLHDVDGHDYLDLLGDYSAGLLGRGDVVAGTIRDVLDRGWSFGAMSEPEAAFAEAVVARFPSHRAGPLHELRQRGQHDGADDGPPRHRAVTASSSSPTATTAARSTSGPAAGRCAAVRLRRAAVQRRRRRRGRRSPSTATTSPPCWSSRCSAPAGASRATPTSSPRCAALTTRRTARCSMFDEVMTSRLAVGGAQAAAGITPDLTTLGKYLAGGLSFGAFGGRPTLMAAFDPTTAGALTHGGTFNNNAFTMAVGRRWRRRSIDAAALAAVNERGDRLRTGLNARFAGVAAAFAATGWGSLARHPPGARAGRIAGRPRRRRSAGGASCSSTTLARRRLLPRPTRLPGADAWTSPTTTPVGFARRGRASSAIRRARRCA